MPQTPYSGKLSQENLMRIGGNKIFAEKDFTKAHWCHQKMPRPQISWRKLLRIATKPQILSPSNVSRYTVPKVY